MQKRPLPVKPAWYQYAYEAQKILDKVKPSRSGNNEERSMAATYRTACAEHGYEGSEADWHMLLYRIRNPKPSRRPYPD
jgi:hypothetical protein